MDASNNSSIIYSEEETETITPYMKSDLSNISNFLKNLENQKELSGQKVSPVETNNVMTPIEEFVKQFLGLNKMENTLKAF